MDELEHIYRAFIGNSCKEIPNVPMSLLLLDVYNRSEVTCPKTEECHISPELKKILGSENISHVTREMSDHFEKGITLLKSMGVNFEK